MSLFLLTDLPHLLLERRKGLLSLVSTSVGLLSFRTRYSGLFEERGGAGFGEAPHQKKLLKVKEPEWHRLRVTLVERDQGNSRNNNNPERQKGIVVVGTGWGFGDFPLCKGSTAQHKGVSWYNSFGIILTEMD